MTACLFCLVVLGCVNGWLEFCEDSLIEAEMNGISKQEKIISQDYHIAVFMNFMHINQVHL